MLCVRWRKELGGGGSKKQQSDIHIYSFIHLQVLGLGRLWPRFAIMDFNGVSVIWLVQSWFGLFYFINFLPTSSIILFVTVWYFGLSQGFVSLLCLIIRTPPPPIILIVKLRLTRQPKASSNPRWRAAASGSHVLSLGTPSQKDTTRSVSRGLTS